MRIDLLGKRLLSINEGPTEDVKSVAKARDWRIAGQGSMYIPDLTQDPNRTFKKMRDLRNIYLQGAYISEGVDLYPLYTIGAGYTLEIDEDKKSKPTLLEDPDANTEKTLSPAEIAKKDVEDFLTGINVYDITWQMMVDAITVRDGLAEIVMGRGSMAERPVNVIPRPAECFEFDTEKSGAILRYIQRNANNGESLGTPVPLEKKQVLHYQFMSRPDSPYGISLIERVIHDIKRDTRVIEATANGICLHGTPKWQIALNKNRPDAAKASDTDWEEFKKQFDEINAKDNFPTEGDIEMIMHDTAGVPNVQQYSDVSLTRVVSGMGIPGELLGLRQGTTDATAVTRVGAFFKKIKSCQRDVEQMWNIVIDMRTGVPGLVKMKLNDTDPQDFAKMATAISQLRTGTDPDAVCPAEWCREQLGIPDDERTDEEKPKKQENPFQPASEAEEWASLKGRIKEMPGGMIEKSQQMVDAEKEMAAAAHELSEAVRMDRELGDDEGTWVTINGAHILIKDGESTGDAFKRTTGKDLTTSHSFQKSGKTISSSSRARTRGSDRDADITISVNGKTVEISPKDVRADPKSPTGYVVDVGDGPVAGEFLPGKKQKVSLSISKEDYDALHSTARTAIDSRVADETGKKIAAWSYEYGVDTGSLHIRPEGVDPIWHDSASKTRTEIASLNRDQQTAFGSELNKVSKQGGSGRYEVSDDDVSLALKSAKQYKSPSTQARDTEIQGKISLAKSTGRDQHISTILVDPKGNEDLPGIETWVKPDGTTYKKKVDYH